MGRQSSDPAAVGSSIALLQERFRQLERVRERREEKELLKLFSEPEKINRTMSFEAAAPKLSFQPQQQPRPPLPPLHHDSSLSLGLNSQIKHANFRAIKTSPSTNSWYADTAAIVSTSSSSEYSDVDTSLHL